MSHADSPNPGPTGRTILPWIGLVAAVLVVALAVWFFATRPPEPEPDPEPTVAFAPPEPAFPEPAPPPPVPAPAPPPPLEAPPAPAPPADPLDDPDSAASAHASVAAELNLVAIRCPLPPDLPTQAPVGPFQPQVVDGWLSDTVMSLEGERGAELRFGPADGGPGNPDVRFELAYIVSWKAERWGEAVRCRIERVRRGDLVVTVVGDDGVPAHGIEVYGCGERGVTEGGRVVLSQVLAGKPCPVWVRHSKDMQRCVAEREVSVPADSSLDVRLELRCGSALDPEVQAEEQAWIEALRAGFRGEASYEMDAGAEIELFARLRGDVDDGTPGAALYDDLIAHRRKVAAQRARAPALIEAMTSGDPEAAAEAVEDLLQGE